MRAQRQLVVLLIVIFLLMAIPIWQDRSIQAEPTFPKSDRTTIGQPASLVVSGETNETSMAEVDMFAFMPVITGVIGIGVGTEAGEVVELVNAQRALVGCAPLKIDPKLTAAAQGHSEDMAVNDFFSHVNLVGQSPWDRIWAEGYYCWSAAENIAAGYPTPASVMAGWMSSEGHRANILNCDLEDIGVGYFYLEDDTGDVNYHYYWTQDFGSEQ